MSEIKLIIAGGREFNDWTIFQEGVLDCTTVLLRGSSLAIVSGMARGADRMGYEFGRLNKLQTYEFPANWDAHGKSAGHKRNAEMGNFSDALLAFWDGKSVGTKGMIDYMKRLNKPVYVMRY